MTTNLRIRVRKATPADKDAISDIHFDAFDDNVMSQLMYPNGPSDDSKAKFRARLFPDSPPKDDAKNGEGFLYVAELLPEDGPADGSGEVVAMAKWTLYREQRPEEEWKTEEFTATRDMFGEGAELDVVNAFIGEMHRVQRDLAKGEASLYLGILACKQNRQRIGAGSALMKWGVDFADSLGLPSRLESSAEGYGLYRKFGYEDVGVFDLDVTGKWGRVKKDGENWGASNAVAFAGPAAEGVERSVIMRRPAKKATA